MDFNVDKANREPSIAIDLASRKDNELFIIPKVGEVKEYGRSHNLDYSVPRFVDDNHYYICTRYKKKKQEFWVTQINPLILKTEGVVYVEETQHGVEGTYLVPRHPRILAAWTNADKLDQVQRELTGITALQFQQAIQASMGIFISDFGLRVDDYPEYQNGTDEERKEIIDAYIKCLDDQYNNELKENEDTKAYIGATEFISNNIAIDNGKKGVLPTWVEKELKKEGVD